MQPGRNLLSVSRQRSGDIPPPQSSANCTKEPLLVWLSSSVANPAQFQCRAHWIATHSIPQAHPTFAQNPDGLTIGGESCLGDRTFVGHRLTDRSFRHDVPEPCRTVSSAEQDQVAIWA